MESPAVVFFEPCYIVVETPFPKCDYVCYFGSLFFHHHMRFKYVVKKCCHVLNLGDSIYFILEFCSPPPLLSYCSTFRLQKVRLRST